MAKWYTVEDMRKMANREKFKCSFVTRTLNGGIILDCTSDVRAMLRQAAEMMDCISKEIERIDSMPGAPLARLFAHQEINGKILIKFFDSVKKIILN